MKTFVVRIVKPDDDEQTFETPNTGKILQALSRMEIGESIVIDRVDDRDHSLL